MDFTNGNRPKKKVVVLGAGVIGLATALKIQEKGGYQVEIIAEVLPIDPKTIKYTSQWAGAHYVSSASKGTKQADIDDSTFVEMWKLSASGGDAVHCFMRISQEEYSSQHPGDHSFDAMPRFREIPSSELIDGANCGFKFDTVTVDVPMYLNYLLFRFFSKGGTITRWNVQHIDQVLEAGATPFKPGAEGRKKEPQRSPDAVIVCVGLGARFLGGVEDANVYPSRGQTVILRAPWVKLGRSFEGDREWTYIIPRKSGNVVLGGVQGVDDWYPSPRPETTKDILRRALAICPELAPPAVRSKRSPEVSDLVPLIVEEGCGLRPMRKGGPRIELEMMESPRGKVVPVVHNYGHGARGFISSIGSAILALQLMEQGIRCNS
jgi:glycine/D-amino acid oxidase-like deaminating enzyme